ncbi:hypothetical protein BJ684DRAFT_17810 [Piptocephalis cylindrospora]|uniref:Uncharacterized protein n=1 Tax=Piptocephalis cylindrospora TaxID=1907219 RepID=A0A4P9XYU6_9FUNG|nr:hypothetical protein BJ684DRAFT_17810 [Piptocephalis cylindrospora]|eukprot:RKP11615.1 hypothetical protein BJ684DRAFT_17810 [Piptocephalis cylindrospora]
MSNEAIWLIGKEEEGIPGQQMEGYWIMGEMVVEDGKCFIQNHQDSLLNEGVDVICAIYLVDTSSVLSASPSLVNHVKESQGSHQQRQDEARERERERERKESGPKRALSWAGAYLEKPFSTLALTTAWNQARPAARGSVSRRRKRGPWEEEVRSPGSQEGRVDSWEETERSCTVPLEQLLPRPTERMEEASGPEMVQKYEAEVQWQRRACTRETQRGIPKNMERVGEAVDFELGRRRGRRRRDWRSPSRYGSSGLGIPGKEEA